MDKFYDPDIQDSTEKYSVVDKYEWAITDQSDVGRTHTIWNQVLNPQISQNKVRTYTYTLLAVYIIFNPVNIGYIHS